MQRHRKGHVHGKYCCFYFWFCFFVMNWWMWLIPCFPNDILYFHVILSICIQYLTIKSWTCSSREIRRQALASVCLEEKVQNNQWVPHTSVTTLLDIYIHGLYLCDLLADRLSVLTLKRAMSNFIRFTLVASFPRGRQRRKAVWGPETSSLASMASLWRGDLTNKFWIWWLTQHATEKCCFQCAGRSFTEVSTADWQALDIKPALECN